MTGTNGRTRKIHPSRLRRILTEIGMVFISFLYLCIAGSLLLFGFIVGWELEPGRPVIGVAMIVAGAIVFNFMPRLIKRFTGRDVISPPSTSCSSQCQIFDRRAFRAQNTTC